jgi:hypothetical protein
MPAPSHQPDPSFQQHAISHTEQECRLPVFEYDFTTCPRQELTELREYEFGREAPRLHRVILAWRDRTGADTLDELLWKCRHTLTQIAPELGHLYVFSPEWPGFPYLDIPQAERSRRFDLLFDDNAELKTLAAQLKAQPSLPGKLSPEALSLIRELRGEKSIENVHWQIDYRFSDREVHRRVDAHLKLHRSCKAKIDVSDRSLRADVKALGAYRLLWAHGGNCWDIVPRLFTYQSEWIKAKRRAEKLIRSIEDPG